MKCEFAIMNDLPSAVFKKEEKVLYGIVLNEERAEEYGMSMQFNNYYNQPF